MGNTKTVYSFETKLAAVKAYKEEGLPQKEVMARFGIVSSSSIKIWCRLYARGGEDALRPKPKGRRRKPENNPFRELTVEEQLRRRIEELEAENAVLKKAAALKISRR